MSKNFTRVVGLTTAVVAASVATASAQISCDPCAVCTPMQPVFQTRYQTVPVTEYQQVRQTVRRPVYQTQYVEQPVTVYRPVTQTQTVQVPTVQYRTVTQNRTVHRDVGRWVTNYRPNPRMAPCQYDCRPGMIGWLNRTGYSMRNAFRPRYTASRSYQPRMVAYSVPYTRQVAVPTTRQVTRNVTRMVAVRTTQRRPVRKLTYVNQEVTVMRPRTTYRSVPIGTSVAYAPGSASSIAYVPGSSSIAYAPSSSSIAYAPSSSSIAYDSSLIGSTIRNAEVIDDRPLQRQALVPEPDDQFRSASRNNSDIRKTPATGGGFKRSSRSAAPTDISRKTIRRSDTAAATADDFGVEPYSRPRQRVGQREPATATGGTPFNGRSRISEPAPAPAGTGARPYERKQRPAVGTDPGSDLNDPFNETKFDDNSTGAIPASRFLRTSATKLPIRKSRDAGWRSSTRVKAVAREVARPTSIAKR